MKNNLSLQDVENLRNTDGCSILLFITDRCPVGCTHCSVNSLSSGPSIEDFELFDQILEALSTRDNLKLVGISGGEPFVERRGLTAAVSKLTNADKSIALYTSGIWAKDSVPRWINEILEKVSCVFLSTDQFHQAQLEEDKFVRATQVIAEANTWLIVQVLDFPSDVSKAKELLERAFGHNWNRYAEFSLISPLPYGRAEHLFLPRIPHNSSYFGKCRKLASQVIRYDGTLLACCNERVIMGYGPQRLRRSVSNRNDLHRELDNIRCLIKCCVMMLSRKA